jgi:signal transduction histidine kinase
MSPPTVSIALLAYVFGFGIAGVACFAALWRALRIEDAETRRGLVGLLVGSGSWALSTLVLFVGSSPAVGNAVYTISLIVGFTTIGAWLYFCSAYTGRSFHRNTRFRRAAVVSYVGVVAVKVTNPLHGRYFTTEFVTTPFPHLAVQHGTFHWVVAGLSYALAAVGFFMLYETFLEADYDTRPIAALVAVMGLPVVFDIVGFATPVLEEVNYEPLGVAVFAVGVLYVFEDRLLAVQLTSNLDDSVVYLDDSGRVQEYNGRAQTLFEPLSAATGEPLAEVLPAVTATLEAGESILELDRNGETRYYLVSDTSFTIGRADLRRMLVLTDVTDTERRRRELERHNEQLEGFAAAVRHELLNTLQIVDGNATFAGDALADGNTQRARDALRKVSETTDRMTAVTEELADLARYGRTIQDTSPVEFGEVVRAAFENAPGERLDLAVEGDGELEADPDRARELLEDAFAFAGHNGASTVWVTLRPDGFAITNDGQPPEDADPEAFFEFGSAVPAADVGLTLPNLRMLARVHGWDVTVDTGYTDGFRIVVSGARVRQQRAA